MKLTFSCKSFWNGKTGFWCTLISDLRIFFFSSLHIQFQANNTYSVKHHHGDPICVRVCGLQRGDRSVQTPSVFPLPRVARSQILHWTTGSVSISEDHIFELWEEPGKACRAGFQCILLETVPKSHDSFCHSSLPCPVRFISLWAPIRLILSPTPPWFRITNWWPLGYNTLPPGLSEVHHRPSGHALANHSHPTYKQGRKHWIPRHIATWKTV